MTGNGPTVAAPAAGDDETSLAQAGSSTDPVDEEIPEEREETAKGSAEEAQTKEHQMTHLPTNPNARFAPGQTPSANRKGKRLYRSNPTLHLHKFLLSSENK